jgi:HD superfamily phosphohydrolase YqeK
VPAIVAAQEEVILAANRDETHTPLTQVIVDAERSILAISDQTVPTRQHVLVSQERDLVDDAFVAGLLHDIGKLVLAASFKGRYCTILAAGRAAGLQATTIEAERFGANHADVGGYLMNLWGLPSPLVEAIAFHHCPEKAMTTAFTPLTAVHVANVLARERDFGDGTSAGVGLHFNYLWELKLLDKIDGWRQLIGVTGLSQANSSPLPRMAASGPRRKPS